ncbi:hypothetical protein GETHLI_33670 [Geothrix limicola]|uniref:Uncharacterized protein n=1 Tax=Geothrix limicola TaxID=2927978 RepID=A0ABQ5QKK7_9BACT|nr:hypothetical protein GETHLI_33670 [Geothrix limicola]
MMPEEGPLPTSTPGRFIRATFAAVAWTGLLLAFLVVGFGLLSLSRLSRRELNPGAELP